MGEYETVEVPTSADEEPMKLVRFGGLSRVDEDGSVQSVHAGELLFAVESETAAEIADLISIELDMRNALGYATEYPAHEEEDGTLASGLFEAAIITYGRSFRQGKSAQARKGQNGKGAPRLKATAYLDVLPQRLPRLHEEIGAKTERIERTLEQVRLSRGSDA